MPPEVEYRPPHLRRNVALITLNGVAFGLVDTLLKPGLVLVVFLAHLTDNPIILGMPLALWTGGFMLSQLAVSGLVRRAPYALPIYRATSLTRMLLWLVLVAATSFVTDAGWLIAVLVAFLIGYPLVWGVAGLVFYEIVGKTIPPRQRGQVFSWRLIGSGLLALVGGWFVNQALAAEDALGFPRNFALIFATASVMTVVGLLSMHAVREPEAQPSPPQPGLRAQWSEIVTIWRGDGLFRHYVLARIALLLAVGTSPLIIVYARQRFELPLSAAGVFLVVDTVTGLLAVAASGWVSTRLGNKPLAQVAAGLGVAVFGLVALAEVLNLTAELAYPYFLVVFVLLALLNAASAVGFLALSLNIPPEGARPLYIGLANTLFGVTSYLSIGQGALVVILGYPGLFLLAAGLAAASLWQVTAHVTDPAVAGEAVYART